MMNTAYEMNDKDMEQVNGGAFHACGRYMKCMKCGRSYLAGEKHTCLRLPQMDEDTRPAIDTTLLGPSLQEQ